MFCCVCALQRWTGVHIICVYTAIHECAVMNWCMHTCTGHLWRVTVSAVVAIATDTVSGSLTGGSAVDRTLQTFVISLCNLEEA